MKLCEIAKDLENRQVFGYKRDGNTVTAHRWKVFPVVGNIWLREPKEDSYGITHYKICLFLPDVKIGLDFGSIDEYQFAEWDENDLIERRYLTFAYYSPAEFLRMEEQKVGESCWIKNSEIEFLRQFAPAEAERLQIYHDEQTKAREERNKARHDEYLRKEAERKAVEERILSEKLDAAENTIRAGGRIENETVNGKPLFFHLFERNGMEIPIKTKGWIADKLRYILVDRSENIRVCFKQSKNAKISQSFVNCYFDLQRKILSA